MEPDYRSHLPKPPDLPSGFREAVWQEINSRQNRSIIARCLEGTLLEAVPLTRIAAGYSALAILLASFAALSLPAIASAQSEPQNAHLDDIFLAFREYPNIGLPHL